MYQVKSNQRYSGWRNLNSMSIDDQNHHVVDDYDYVRSSDSYRMEVIVDGHGVPDDCETVGYS